jgi:toxin FitB
VRFIVDANVLSESTKPRPSARVVEWLRKNERRIAVNPIVLGELEFGILLLPAGRRRKRLLDWFKEGVQTIRVVDLNAETAAVWARLVAELKRSGRAMPVKDSLIAATARQHSLTVATRNTADYQHAGVTLINPFAD